MMQVEHYVYLNGASHSDERNEDEADKAEFLAFG